MEFGLATWKDFAEFIAYCVTAISLVGITIAYAFSRKQMHFATMVKCIDDFRKLTEDENIKPESRARRYIDLVNEEFFYIENRYLPMTVAVEWIDGMIDYLPFFCDNQFIPSTHLEYLATRENVIKLLREHPRVYNAINLLKKIDFDQVRNASSETVDTKSRSHRKKVIEGVVNNLNVGVFTKCRLSRALKKF